MKENESVHLTRVKIKYIKKVMTTYAKNIFFRV